jgi:hypothetical protein
MIAEAASQEAIPEADAGALECQGTLRNLQMAIQIWALDNRASASTTVTMDELVNGQYLNMRPTCPAGGVYGSSAGPNVFVVSEPPTCSLGGAHAIP